MRAQVKILRKEIKVEKPDCTVIMINPGSCSPADPDYIYPSQQEKEEFTQAEDDQTQHQLMRLMHRMGYNRLDIFESF